MKKKIVNNLTIIDLSLITIGILSLIVIHVLREDGDVIANSLSNYAVSEYGYFVSIIFYIFAFVNILIGFLYMHFKNKKIRFMSKLFFLCSLFMLALTIFHTDGNGIMETSQEYIHIVSAILLFITYPVIILIGGFQYKTKRLRSYSIISASIVSVLTLFGIVFTVNNLKSGLLETTFLGLFEKVGVLIILVWMIILLMSRNKLKEVE